jgi:hypothetical protein
MSTRLTRTMTYDAALEDVGAMLDDPDFRREVVEAQGGTARAIEIDVADDTSTVLIDQVQASAGIPSFARKIVGETINIVQRETWTSADQADLEVSIPGKPGQMIGTITLVEDGGTTTETVDVDITVNIPLVSGKLEKLISDLLSKALRAEERVARDYLSR